MENATQPVPLIELRDIRKRYGGNGTPEVEVLKGVSLSIHAGEFVAIVGASGSGKSTLMNILGCLDRPSSGSYHFAGHDVAELDSDEQAWLRREAFGFVFQGYHLIPSASAQENVEMPAIYAGTPASERHTRARALLERLGLAERTANRPHQLSGGQQQRVSIARALMNGGHIILADEPTGALDSHSGAEVMALLDELASQGHVVILITHDRDVAARAKRIIEVRDGEIVSDSANDERPAHPSAGVERHLQADDLSQRLAEGSSEPSGAWRAELLEAVRAAWRVMWINRFRTALTLLGIIIGVASVVVMLAVGEGSKRQVMAQMGAFGSNIIYLSGYSPNPRAPMGIVSSDDVAAIATLPQVKKVMPVNGGELVVRYGNIDYHAYVGGNNTDFPEILNWPVAEGSYFTERDEDAATTVAVIGYKVRKKLFGSANPIGRYILIENVPFQVIGVLAEKGSSSGDKDADNRIAIPYSAASIRLFGTRNPEYVIIAAADAQRVHQAERAIDQLMLRLHRGQRDYELTNNAAMIQAEAKTQNTLSLMLGSIAAISLLVGGIGVMNIMLMTVRERTREIGIRMATGARQGDILRQFLTEAAMLSVVGGLAGIALALCIGGVLLLGQVAVAFSLSAIVPGVRLHAGAQGRPAGPGGRPGQPMTDMSMKNLSLISACLLLGACGSTPAPLDSGLAAPPQWRYLAAGRSDASDIRQWWKAFGAPELDSLLQRALLNSQDLGAAVARVRQAQASAVIAGAPLLPELNATLGASRQKLLRDSGYSGTDATSDNDAVDSFSAGLSASYEVDFWGGRRAAYRSALESLKASEYDRATVELTLLSGVANSYLQVLALREQQRIARLNLDNAEHVLRLVETRHAAGSATALEVAQQSSLVASQRKQLPLLEQQAHEALITLATLIGEPVQALQVAERPFDSLRWPETGAGLPSELLSRRPDIANAEAQLAAAQADVQVARAALFPKLTLSASLSSGANRAADTFRNPYYNLGANLLAPIFNHGRLRAERDRSLARQEELLETYRKAILTAFADTERSLNSIDGLDRQLHWQQQELEQAQRAFDLSDSRYQAGAETLLTVLETQRTLYAAQDAAVQLRLARLQASVGLYKALGGGWQSDRQGLARKD